MQLNLNLKQSMGLELPKYPEMEEDQVLNFTDSEIVSHVKNALASVLSVSAQRHTRTLTLSIVLSNSTALISCIIFSG